MPASMFQAFICNALLRQLLWKVWEIVKGESNLQTQKCFTKPINVLQPAEYCYPCTSESDVLPPVRFVCILLAGIYANVLCGILNMDAARILTRAASVNVCDNANVDMEQERQMN